MKFLRFGISDVVFEEKDAEKIYSKYCVRVVDKDGKVIAEPELYFVCEEDENGEEVD